MHSFISRWFKTFFILGHVFPSLICRFSVVYLASGWRPVSHQNKAFGPGLSLHVCPQHHQAVQSATDNAEDAKSASARFVLKEGALVRISPVPLAPPPQPPKPPLSLYYLWKVLSLIALRHEHAGKDDLGNQHCFPIARCRSRFASHVGKTPMLQKRVLCHNWHAFESVMVSRCRVWSCPGSVVLESSSFGDPTCVKVKWNLLSFSCFVGLYIQWRSEEGLFSVSLLISAL